MKTSRSSGPQILAILRQAEGGIPGPVCAGSTERAQRRFISMVGSPFASLMLKRSDIDRLQTSIRCHHFRSAQMEYPHTYASTNGRPCRHYKRQVPYVPLRPFIPFQPSTCNSHGCSQGLARYSPPC